MTTRYEIITRRAVTKNAPATGDWIVDLLTPPAVSVPRVVAGIGTLRTDHAMSSRGQPVVVDEAGNAYGADDCVLRVYDLDDGPAEQTERPARDAGYTVVP